LGALIGISSAVVPLLQSLLHDRRDDKPTGIMVASSLRYALARPRSATYVTTINSLHSGVMLQFLPLIQDTDLNVKKAGLLMVNTALHHCPETSKFCFMSKPLHMGEICSSIIVPAPLTYV
jgi:hypothetical protein